MKISSEKVRKMLHFFLIQSLFLHPFECLKEIKNLFAITFHLVKIVFFENFCTCFEVAVLLILYFQAVIYNIK